MSRPRPLPGLVQNALVAAFGLVAIYAALIPLGTGSGGIAPDLLYCLAVAWVIRRPASAPLWIILALGLFGDVMLSRPIGLGALGLMLVTELARANAARFHGAPFLLEWLAAAVAFAAMLAGMQALLRLSFADGPGTLALAGYLAATTLAYPVVAAGLVWGLGVRGPRGGRAGGAPGRVP